MLQQGLHILSFLCKLAVMGRLSVVAVSSIFTPQKCTKNIKSNDGATTNSTAFKSSIRFSIKSVQKFGK